MSFNSHLSFVANAHGLLVKRTLPRFLAFVLIACCFAPGLSAKAQLQLNPRPEAGPSDGSSTNEAGSSNRNSEDGPPNLQKLPPEKLFRMLLEKIRKNSAEINHLYSTMPLGFPASQKKYMDQIDALTKQTDQMKIALPKAAIEAFKADPGKDPVASQFVAQTLNEMIDPSLPNSVFDPAGALEIVDTLMDAGADQDVVVLSKGFRASFALEDYDRAALMLDRILDVNPEGDLTQIQQVVEDMKEKWQRELMIRRLEKNNDSLPKIKFETTAGNFEVVLYEDHAPNTVANFISLVKKKFYNDLIFHYVKPGEYIHTGSPNGDNTGGPGYAISSEFNREQIRHFFSGTLGMANTGPDTEGSQFVITHQAIPQLDGQFTAFGRVIDGFDVIRNATAISPEDPPPAEGVKAKEPIRIIKAEVIRARDHEYEPERINKAGISDILGGGEDSSQVDDIFGSRSASQDAPPIDGGGLFSPSNP